MNQPRDTAPFARRQVAVVLGLLALCALPVLVLSQGSDPAAAQDNAKAAPPPPVAPAGLALATFAGGCFWCVEADFDKVPGVLATVSGYTGGRVVNPSYEDVSSKTTGHAEVVQITFDPAKVSYEQLLKVYWHSIDPTTVDRQFCDVGSPYRTAIYTHGPEQAAAARASLADLAKSKPFPQDIVTRIEEAPAFYAAEDYHQNYYKKNPVRYAYYRSSCGRDARLEQLWGAKKQP
jgi:peptide-methionine (S)-S-oxide reductase